MYQQQNIVHTYVHVLKQMYWTKQNGTNWIQLLWFTFLVILVNILTLSGDGKIIKVFKNRR